MILYVNTKTLSSNNHLVVLRKEFIIATPIFIPINYYFFRSFLSLQVYRCGPEWEYIYLLSERMKKKIVGAIQAMVQTFCSAMYGAKKRAGERKEDMCVVIEMVIKKTLKNT